MSFDEAKTRYEYHVAQGNKCMAFMYRLALCLHQGV